MLTMPLLSSSEHNSKILEQNSSDALNEKSSSSLILSKSDLPYPAMYKDKDNNIKYGLVYNTQMKLSKETIAMSKAINEQNKIADKHKLTPVPKINVFEKSGGYVYFVDINSLTSRVIPEHNFYEIIPEASLIHLNRRIKGSSDEINLSEMDNGQPAYYNEQYGAAYCSQFEFMWAFDHYFDEYNSVPNPDIPVIEADKTYFVPFANLFQRKTKPFEIVDAADIDFIVSNDVKFQGSSKNPGTPSSGFSSSKKKNAKGSVNFNETPSEPISNIPAVSNGIKTAPTTKSNRNNQSDNGNNVVTPYEELDNDTKIVIYEKYLARVPGPSDIVKSLKPTKTRKSVTDVEKDKQREIALKQQEIYSTLKMNIGWRHDNDPNVGGDDREIFFTPLCKGSTKEGIENLSFFHTKSACYEHFRQNPCLSLKTTDEMLSLLKTHGWIQEEREDKKSNTSYTSFTYKPAKDTLKVVTPGLHYFNNYKALVQFVSRFPFALQDNDTFANTLSLHGWTEKKKKWSVDGRNLDSLTLAEVRKEIWLNPSLLFQNISPSLSAETIMKFICIPKEDAESKSLLSSTPPQSIQKPKKLPFEETDSDNLLKSTSSSAAELSNLAKQYCSMSPNDIKERDSLRGQMTRIMQPENGWYEWECHWTNEWWKYEKATIAPWSIGNEAEMIAGIDFFWDFDDIANYINEYDHVRQNKSSLKLLHDYTSNEWDINRRIEELVKKHPDIFSKKCPIKFWEMLQSTGWTKISPKGNLRKIIAFDTIFVPKWSKLSNDNFSDYGLLEQKIHYFHSESDALKYLKENGNIEPSRYEEMSEIVDNSSAVSSGSPPKTPHTPHRAVAHITDPTGTWQKSRHIDTYLFPSVWLKLCKMGYRLITEKGPLENTLYITPETRLRLEDKIDKNIENHLKVDMKMHSALKAGTDYFITRDELMKYVTKRYEPFRESYQEQSKGNDDGKNKKVNTKKKVNAVSTPTAASSNGNGGDVDMISKLLMNKDCDFDALWNELVKEGWTKTDDNEGIKYLAAWASDMTSDEWTLNREYYINQDELLKYLRGIRKIKIDDAATRNTIKTEVKAKKRGNETDDDLLTSVKKNKRSDPDTIAKFQKTPEDPILALRYIMKEGGKWENDHQGSSKTGSIMGQLREIGWEHLTLIGHNDSSAYFTKEAIELIKEIDDVDSVNANYKVNGKTTLIQLTENKHYFIDQDDVIKFVDINYCGADISKYPEKTRRQRAMNINAGIDEKKAKAPVEVKQNSKTSTPKNTTKRKQPESAEPTPESMTSMTSETEEEELQRWIEEKVRFGQIWETFLSKHGWETAFASNDVTSNYWVAPWAKLKEGAALKAKGKWDVKKLTRNLDYFVERQDILDYIMIHGLQEATDHETIIKKNDRAIGKFIDTRSTAKLDGIDSDSEDGDGVLQLNDVKNKKISPRLSHDLHESEEIERLTSAYHSSPDVNEDYYGEDSPDAESSASAFGESRKRAAERREPESLKKIKAPIEDDIKTIRQAIQLAKDALTTSDVVETNVVGREKQYQQLSDSISNALENRSGKGMYVCGSPGGGKTLLVSKVINSFSSRIKDETEESSPSILNVIYDYISLLGSPSKKSSVPYQIIRIGGTSILNANQFYSKVLCELDGDATGSTNYHDLKSRVYKKFTNNVVQGKQSPKTQPPMIILVIDEIDRAPIDLVAELFLATAETNSTLILIGIANLVTFPEQGLPGLTDEAMPETIVFEPYTEEQLKEILRKRLFNLFDAFGLQFLSMKAKKSGDVRTLIEIASLCVNTIEDDYIKQGISMDENLTKPIIDKNMVLRVTKSMGADPDLEALKKTSRNGLNVLVSLVLASGSGAMTISDMLNSYNTFLAQKSLAGVSNDEFRTLFEELNNNGFLVAENMSGFSTGGRPKRSKSHDTKYHIKTTREKLIKVLKEKSTEFGVADLEKMKKNSDIDEFDF